ncbi:MAG: hypothetical protein NC127_08600 [Muribaculum sp.]|nr:hypothetical protein [Muribaculum sp.]
MDYLEEALQLATENRGNDFFASINVMNLPFLLSNTNKREFKYVVDRMTGWFESGYENSNNGLARILTTELSKDIKNRRLDLSDHELVNLILNCKATAGSSLSNLLHIPAVREAYIEKSSEGERRYTFALGTYYYDSEEYAAAFNTLKTLKDDHTMKYLGLMYYYGKGTEPNRELATEYLERYHESIWCVEPEVIWALGDLYSHNDGVQKQFDLYITELKNPYVDYDNLFIKRMLKRCMTLQRHDIVKDNMSMTIEVESEDLVCEFSLDIAPYCHLTINWGDKTCDTSGNIEKNGTVTCRHKYTTSGTYTIIIESLWEKVIEGFNFSRHKRKLHNINLDNCPGLKKLSIVGQCLTNLELTSRCCRKDYLTGIICRDNKITKLDLRGCPNITQLDCSKNEIKSLKLPENSALSRVSFPNTKVNKSKIDEILRLNRGYYCELMDYDGLSPVDMRLEYYFRCSTWDKVRKYIRKNEQDYYNHALSECELAFAKLKNLSRNVNINLYEEKGGFLAIHDSYVSDDTICHNEEFFIVEESWTTCLATKVRDTRRREPWMGFPPTSAEYFVANCLVNMIQNQQEMKNLYK